MPIDNDLFNLVEYLIKRHLPDRANHTALLLIDDVDKHRAITYQALYHDVCRLTVGIKSMMLPHRSVVGIQSEDVYDLLLLFLATNAAGFIPIPLLSSLSADELTYILQDSNTQIYFRLMPRDDHLQIPADCQLIEYDQYEKLKKSPAEEIKIVTRLNDPAFIFYTSGSSGYPKGVLHAQHAILGRKPSIENWLTLTPSDIVMQTDNLCWTYSMFTGFIDPLMVGATAAIMTASNRSSKAEDKISAEKWFDIIERFNITIMASTPDIYHTLTLSPSIKRFTRYSLRQAGSAGAYLPETVQQSWIAHFHFPIFIALGMSELSTFISTGPNVPYRQNKVGKIQPGRKVTILPIDDGFNTVPMDTQGMLAIHRDELGLMINYVGHDHHQTQYRGEWFLTQDIVSMDRDHYIQYYGRADLLIKVDGGFRVSPLEIENELKRHQAVIDAACGVIYDPNTTCDKIIVYIVSKDRDEKSVRDIYQFLLKHLSDYKVPDYFYFVDQLPMNDRGKVIRRALGNLQPLQKYQVINGNIQIQP